MIVLNDLSAGVSSLYGKNCLQIGDCTAGGGWLPFISVVAVICAASQSQTAEIRVTKEEKEIISLQKMKHRADRQNETAAKNPNTKGCG